jgi:protein-disulfide isomerase
MMPRRLSAALLALTLAGCGGKDGAATRAADAATLQTAAATKPQGADSTLAKADAGRILGSDKAGVWMIVISDFQCPYCKRWHDETWETIKKDYVDTGKLRVAYVNLPLSMHRNAQPAAEAAMCAAVQGKFWPLQDALFRTQKEWEELGDAHPKFEALAKDVGVDVPALRACVQAGATRALVQADVDRATNAGASSTPTFFIGGRALLGAQPLETFRSAIDAALAAKPAGK